ncbi:Protein tweety [Blattella germanica]|nr:Protein tweety [Blattella germanica]
MEPHTQNMHQRDNDVYSPPPLARFFHAFPHLNITCHLVNATFDPDSSIYLESLGILGSIPAAWLILTLLVLLIYLLTRCCDRKPRPKHSIVALKWTLAIFTLLCCAAIGVGLYGNDDVHNGLVQFITATQSMDDIITSTGAIETTLTEKVEPLLTDLGDVFDGPVANLTAREMVLSALKAVTGNSTTALHSFQKIYNPLKGVSLKGIISIVSTAETIRWPVTMVMLSILLVFCVVLLFGVARHSRCALITYGLSFMLAASVAAGFFFTVLVWVDSHTWIYIRRRRDYLQVDEQDPFLPPSAASQAIAARTLRSQGSYGSTGYFRQHHHSPHHHHHTPPPTPPYPGTLYVAWLS